MQEGEKRLAIVAVLSVANIPVVNIYFGAFWPARGWNPQAKAGLLAHLAVWIASLTSLVPSLCAAGSGRSRLLSPRLGKDRSA